MIKKTILLLLTVSLLFLCACSADTSTETTEVLGTLPDGAAEIGTSSYSCVTGESIETQSLSETLTAVVKAFSHRIYDPDNEYVVTLTNTVIGIYSSDAAKISSVSGTLSDAETEGFTVSEHVSGDTATVVLYLNNISVCHFQYRISPDGTLEFL